MMKRYGMQWMACLAAWTVCEAGGPYLPRVGPVTLRFAPEITQSPQNVLPPLAMHTLQRVDPDTQATNQVDEANWPTPPIETSSVPNIQPLPENRYDRAELVRPPDAWITPVLTNQGALFSFPVQGVNFMPPQVPAPMSRATYVTTPRP